MLCALACSIIETDTSVKYKFNMISFSFARVVLMVKIFLGSQQGSQCMTIVFDFWKEQDFRNTCVGNLTAEIFTLDDVVRTVGLEFD